MSEIKVIQRGLVVNGEVYYKVEDKSLTCDNCNKCDLKKLCKNEPSEFTFYCRSIYINGHFEKQNSLLNINSVVLSQVEVNFNNRFFVTKWDPRYEGCRHCVIYKLYVDPEVTGFSEECGRSISCDLEIPLKDSVIRLKDLCNPDEHEVFQFKQEIRI